MHHGLQYMLKQMNFLSIYQSHYTCFYLQVSVQPKLVNIAIINTNKVN
jgi:hypothetical protein